MKVLIFVIVLVSLIGLNLAAVSRGSFADPKHPGKCVIKSNLILSPGEHKDPNTECGRIICEADGSAEFHTCGVMAPPPGYKFGKYLDTSLNYPDCCKRELTKE